MFEFRKCRLPRPGWGLQSFLGASFVLTSLCGAAPPIEQQDRAKPNAVVEANNQFGLDLYQQLQANESGNLFFSPLSISSALAMTYAGANGETEEQMAKVLHFKLPEEKLHESFAALLHKAVDDKKSPGYQLIIANRLWGQRGFQFLPEFLAVTEKQYDAQLAPVDFARQTEAARQEINAWVAKETENKIQELMPQGVLDEMTRLVLTNAIYFKGKWTDPFEKEMTDEADFRVSEEEQVQVPMMHQTEVFPYYAERGLQVLAMPYGEKDLSMVVLLPEKVDGLAELEKKMTTENLQQWISRLRPREVEVFFPRFKSTSQFQLNDVLQSLGMTSAFQPKRADFSGISSQQELYLSAVIHKAFVEVNEEGTEAAAATGVAVSVTSAVEPAEIPVFRADHPFVFLIRDNRTGAILFLGRQVNPQ